MATPRPCASSFHAGIPRDAQSTTAIASKSRRRKDRICANAIRNSREHTNHLLRAYPFLQNKPQLSIDDKLAGYVPPNSIQFAIQDLSQKIDWVIHAVSMLASSPCDPYMHMLISLGLSGEHLAQQCAAGLKIQLAWRKYMDSKKQAHTDSIYQVDGQESSDRPIHNDTDDQVFDLWPLLAGMANHHHVSTAGATLETQDTVHEEFEGESRLNRMISKREANQLLFLQTQEVVQDDSWKVGCGDIVYMDSTARPLLVFRTGYGEYESEVRVCGIFEDTNKWSTGMWVNTARLYKLEISDKLEALSDIIDATEKRGIIKKGTICIFRGWDEDGDALVRVKAENRMVSTTIFYDDFDQLTLC